MCGIVGILGNHEASPILLDALKRLDGTLADTSKDLIAAANSCFEKLGLTIMLDPINDASVAV